MQPFKLAYCDMMVWTRGKRPREKMRELIANFPRELQGETFRWLNAASLGAAHGCCRGWHASSEAECSRRLKIMKPLAYSLSRNSNGSRMLLLGQLWNAAARSEWDSGTLSALRWALDLHDPCSIRIRFSEPARRLHSKPFFEAVLDLDEVQIDSVGVVKPPQGYFYEPRQYRMSFPSVLAKEASLPAGDVRLTVHALLAPDYELCLYDGVLDGPNAIPEQVRRTTSTTIAGATDVCLENSEYMSASSQSEYTSSDEMTVNAMCRAFQLGGRRTASELEERIVALQAARHSEKLRRSGGDQAMWVEFINSEEAHARAELQLKDGPVILRSVELSVCLSNSPAANLHNYFTKMQRKVVPSYGLSADDFSVVAELYLISPQDNLHKGDLSALSFIDNEAVPVCSVLCKIDGWNIKFEQCECGCEQASQTFDLPCLQPFHIPNGQIVYPRPIQSR